MPGLTDSPQSWTEFYFQTKVIGQWIACAVVLVLVLLGLGLDAIDRFRDKRRERRQTR